MDVGTRLIIDGKDYISVPAIQRETCVGCAIRNISNLCNYHCDLNDNILKEGHFLEDLVSFSISYMQRKGTNVTTKEIIDNFNGI